MKKGFTLIELLIVVAMIGIIAGIAIPIFLGTSKVEIPSESGGPKDRAVIHREIYGESK